MRLSSYSLGAAALVLAAFPVSAATLIGANVTEQYYYPDTASPYGPAAYAPQSFVVGAGQESTVVLEGVTTFGVDFSAAALDLTFDTTLSGPTFGSASFNGLIFTSGAFGQFTDVTVRGITNLAGFDASRVSLAGNELRIDWNGLSYDSGTVIGLDFNSAVPEPATWALLVFGFAMTGASMRRRNRLAFRG